MNDRDSIGAYELSIGWLVGMISRNSWFFWGYVGSLLKFISLGIYSFL